MNIVNMISSNKNHYKGVNKRLYITIHDTGNKDKGANAIRHAKLINNGFNATWHYTVDDTRVVKHYDETVQCWHCGDGKGNGNLNSIGIEMCVNIDGDFNKTVNNTIELVKYLMDKFNIPIENVVQHNKWSGKNCPTTLRSGKPISWYEFKNRLKVNNNPSNKLYKIQVGAYSNKNNAIKRSEELKQLGIDNFIVEYENK